MFKPKRRDTPRKTVGRMTILVIGSGSIGTRHFNNLGLLAVKAEVLSVRAVGLAGALARIDAGELRGAVIATQTQLRLPLIEACAAAGLPMYIEKPLAFEPAELAAIYTATSAVASRSVVGFMMRYHPAFRHLAQADLTDTYRFSFDIGHDVTQWRTNWQFADSYAARSAGGGVLLDLCHELDMAACLFPAASIGAVQSIGHLRYPEVDFATRVSFSGPVLGSVSMDYLSPVSTRKIDIAGTTQRHSFDLAAGTYAGPTPLAFPFDRNQMFLAAMRDFLALIDGRLTSDVEHLPRLDRVRRHCEVIAEAYTARAFTAHLTGEKP